MRIQSFWLAAALLCAAVGGGSYAPSAGADDEQALLSPCRLSGADGRRLIRARCGELRVPLDPSDPDGALIALSIATVPALNANENTVALTVIAGGPGQSSIDFYAAYQPAFERLREQFDIVLVDQRGTGKSTRLDCTLPSQTLGDIWSLDLTAQMTRDCLAQIDEDLRFFTTSVAVQDLERVRAVLGYEQFAIYGVSYGTRVAQHYLRRFAERTHSVILDGVVPVDEALGPDIPVQAQRALDLTIARCADSEACNNAYPTLRADVADLLATLRGGPVKVTLNHPLSAVPTEVTLSYQDMTGAIRLLSYTPLSKALLPLFLHEAANANYQPIAAEALRISDDFVAQLALGMHNSVICAEDVPFFGDLDEDRLSKTYMGSFIARAMQTTCDLWPRGVMDPDFKFVFASEVPVLVLSGELDPITPPAYGERAAAYLQNARHLVGPGQGHSIAAVGCVPRLMGEFTRERAPATLDASCLTDKQNGEPFFTSFSGPEP